MSSPVPGVAQITLWFSCIMPSTLLSSRLPISRPYTGCTRRWARVPSGARCGPRKKPSPCQRNIHRRRRRIGRRTSPDRRRSRGAVDRHRGCPFVSVTCHCRELAVLFSTRHCQCVPSNRGGCRVLGYNFSHLDGIQCSRRDLSKNPVWMPASRLAAADRVSGVSGAGWRWLHDGSRCTALSRWTIFKGVLFVLHPHARMRGFEERGRRLHRCVRRIDRPLALEAGESSVGIRPVVAIAPPRKKVLAVSLFRPA